MQAFDFSPLFRSTVGFDRLTSLLDATTRLDDGAVGYPPYNIEQTGENAYRIVMAVAGFRDSDISLVQQANSLVISGKQEKTQEEKKYLHRGIAARAFERRFALADHVKVTGANLADGVLSVDLVREVPEAMKPRTIKIADGKIANGESKVIENKAA